MATAEASHGVTDDIPAIPTRPFGRHCEQVSIIGLGGSHLGKVKTTTEATRIVHEAIAAGMTFMDNDALRYAMSLPVCTTVSGIDSLKVLRQNLRIAGGFEPMSDRARRAYEKRLAAFATDGRFELDKTTAQHEGKVGRQQHGYPSEEEMAG